MTRRLAIQTSSIFGGLGGQKRSAHRTKKAATKAERLQSLLAKAVKRNVDVGALLSGVRGRPAKRARGGGAAAAAVVVTPRGPRT